MNYSLEDGLEPSSLIVSVYIHWRRNPGIKKNWVLSVENVLRRLLIQLKAHGHVGKEDVKESETLKNLKHFATDIEALSGKYWQRCRITCWR